MVIRPETEADHASIRAIVTSAFGSEVEGDLIDRIRASPEYMPELALVCVTDGEIVGHVMISGATVRHQTGERAIVMLSPLAVDPAHQRRGIGAALVSQVSEMADQRNEPVIVLEGNPAYYGRFGFEHSLAHGLTIHLPDWAPPEAAQVKLLSSYEDNDPTLRGEVIYPPAFDSLE